MVDRFDREYEDLGQTPPQNPLAVAAVPEPEEWLLLILAAGLLAWRARSRACPAGCRGNEGERS